MVFGLLRVVGCGVCNNFHAFIPLQLCDKARNALIVLWVYCVDFLINGIGWINDDLFRLALRLRREVNLNAVSLIHLVEACSSTLWRIEHCLVSCIRKILWAWISRFLFALILAFSLL